MTLEAKLHTLAPYAQLPPSFYIGEAIVAGIGIACYAIKTYLI